MNWKGEPGMSTSLYLTVTVWIPSSYGTKLTAYRPSSSSLTLALLDFPEGDVTVASRSLTEIPGILKVRRHCEPTSVTGTASLILLMFSVIFSLPSPDMGTWKGDPGTWESANLMLMM